MARGLGSMTMVGYFVMGVVVVVAVAVGVVVGAQLQLGWM